MTSISYRTRGPAEEGSVSLFLVVLLLAVFAVFGLVVDGGARLDGQRRATDQAEQAARAAAQAINPTSLRDTGTPALDPATARAAASRYLASVGNITLTGVNVTGTTVTVTVTVTTTVAPAVLSIIGVGALTVTGTGRAQLLRGNIAAGTP
jgi:Flp pilus assembly protein TadG